MANSAYREFNFGLGEVIDAVREQARRFAQERIAPRANEIDRSNAFPRDLWREPRRTRAARHDGEPRLRRRRPGLPGAHHRHGGNLARVGSRGLSYGAHSNLCVNQLALNATEAQKQKYLPKTHQRRTCGRARDVRTRRRFRRRLHAAQGHQAGRPVRARRAQDVDHQRPGGRCPGGLRQDQPERPAARHQRVHHREGLQGIHAGAKARQARHARFEHQRIGVRRLRGARREPHRRGEPRASAY